MVYKLHLYLGTKGEIIKMAPIMRELQNRGIDYNFIHSGQHLVTTSKLIKDFKLKEPDIILDKRENDVSSFPQAISATIRNISKAIYKNKQVFKNDRQGLCCLFADTNTTMQGLIISKLLGFKTAHIEAGERSHNIFEPFPEEIVKRIVSKYADYLFPTSEVAVSNLQDKKVKGKIFPIRHNTILDSVRLALKLKPKITLPKEKYVVATIHRFETIYSKERLTKAIDILEKVSSRIKVMYALHPSTNNRLIRYNLLERLRKNSNIDINPLYDYIAFMNLINKSEFLVTDGAGPQEEGYIMDKPCLLLRNVNERFWHDTVYLSKLEPNSVDYFFNNLDKFHRKGNLEDPNYSPAREIVNILENQI